MAKQQLNRTEVGTAFEQMDCKRVAQECGVTGLVMPDRSRVCWQTRSTACRVIGCPDRSPGNNHSFGWVSFQYFRRMSNNLGESIT
jgi:hypothetical protein